MKRIDINSNQLNFIGAWNLENNNLCNEIIDFFEKNQALQKKGGTSDASNNKKVKSTIDITIKPTNLEDKNFNVFNNYMKELHDCYLDYQKQWPFLKSMLNDIQIPPFNIQKYNPGDHFSTVHSERTSLNTLHRLFAFMTYLNDVEDGGETHFTHYKFKVKPEIGKTLIWPAEWTHAHTGEILKSGTKYIVTGWMNFPV
tara:strand:+ start:334 stop:930 length:597 start_codon:yes stop_codon:yes gene_type:complete